MTAGELLARASSRELSEWQALYRIEDEERKAVSAAEAAQPAGQ